MKSEILIPPVNRDVTVRMKDSDRKELLLDLMSICNEDMSEKIEELIVCLKHAVEVEVPF